MIKIIILIQTLLLLSITVFAELDTLVMQNGSDGYDGCEDRSIFQFKKSSPESKWGGSMAGTFPEMAVHGEEANDGETPKLAFGQLIC